MNFQFLMKSFYSGIAVLAGLLIRGTTKKMYIK